MPRTHETGSSGLCRSPLRRCRQQNQKPEVILDFIGSLRSAQCMKYLCGGGREEKKEEKEEAPGGE